MVLVAGGFATAVGVFWVRYENKFGTIDKSRESLSWDPDQSNATSTIYANPAYGVSLNLPGKWVHTRPPYKCFCTLSGPGKFVTMFWPLFPAPSPSVDAEAASISTNYRTRAGWILQSNESTPINRRPARLLRYKISNLHSDFMLVLVKQWPVMYASGITGPESSDEWQQIGDALPHALTIQ
ncbi:MAG TPA: hypothetical protein VJO53_04470 [Candidatus Acidoferrales bacterium]|nr:hypothetical protein [Candidatus Acidoferrales bacterium]